MNTSYWKGKLEIREKQAKSENISYYALKNPSWEQGWWRSGCDTEWLLETKSYPPLYTGKTHWFPGFYPAFHGRALSILQQHLFWHREGRSFDHLLNVQFSPRGERLKEKEEEEKNQQNKTKLTPPCTLDEQEYGFIKYLAPSSQ